jgi:anti-sigma B factor antagonist
MTVADLPSEFHVFIVGVDGAATVQVGGEIDMATAPDLRERLNWVISTTTGNVVVDLTGVTFLDSTGLVVFVAAERQLNATGRRLILRNPSKFVFRVLDLSGVADALGVGPPALETAAD